MSAKSVRQIGIIDIPRLRNLRRAHVSLVFPDAIHPSQFEDMLAATPLGRRYARVFVTGPADSPSAMVELRPEPDDFRWVVTGLGARNIAERDRLPEVVDSWSDLLSYAVRAAGADGAKRVHATVPPDGPAYEALVRAGFSTYAYQTVMLAEGLALEHVPEDGIQVREREPSDTWSIHHLYHLTTPRPVQYAEALTSNHWDSRHGLSSRSRGFVVDDKDGLAGFCQISGRGSQFTLDLLILPAKLAMLVPLIAQSVKLAKLPADAAIWVGVPDYHAEYTQALESLGLQAVGRLASMVRYTMVPACGQPSRWANVVANVIERLPARAPVVTRYEPMPGRAHPIRIGSVL